MAHFTASYGQGDNNDWLNELFRDIAQTTEHNIDDGNRDRNSRASIRLSRTLLSTRSAHSPFEALSRFKSPGRSEPPATNESVKTLLPYAPSRPVSEVSTRLSADCHDTTSLGSPISRLSSNLPPSTIAFDSKSSSSATKHLIPRPAATHHRQQSFSTRLSRISSSSSIASDFSGFAPHPGVRPLAITEDRSVLGKAAGPTDDDHEYPGPLPLALIIVGICLSVFVISLDRNIITTAIPEITARFHSYDDIGWYGSAYLLTASAFQPLYGRIYMSFDTKQSFLYAVGVFEIGSLICGISPSSKVLIIGRAIQGIGSAGILTGSFVVGTHSVRLQARPILFAFVGILYGVGALCGPLLGGVFTDLISWRWCFYINLPVGGITFLSVLIFFTSQKHDSSIVSIPFMKRVLALDWIGNIILLGACTMLFLALQFSEERYSWSSARCIGLICGFGVTAMIFVAWMFHKGTAALIPIHVIRQRTVAASCGAAFFIYGALLLHSYYLPIWFQAVKGASAIGSGVNMIPYMVVNAFFSLFAGIFVAKNGLFAPPAILGCAIGTVGAGLLATLQPNTSTATWVGFEVLVSAGLGMAIQQGFSAVQTVLPLKEVPIGTAAVVACQSAGGAIFVSIGNTLLQNHLLSENSANAIPGVNIRSIIELGTIRFRAVVPAADLPALINLYNDALQAALIAAVPLCGCAFLCSLCMEWKSLKRKAIGEPVDTEANAANIGEKRENEDSGVNENANRTTVSSAATLGADGYDDYEKPKSSFSAIRSIKRFSRGSEKSSKR